MVTDIFFLDIFSRPFADCEHVSKINSDYISYLHGVIGVYLIYCSPITVRTLKLDVQPHLECTVSVWISCSYERNRDSFIDVHFFLISVYDNILCFTDVLPHLQAHRLSLQEKASDPLKEMLAFSNRDR